MLVYGEAQPFLKPIKITQILNKNAKKYSFLVNSMLEGASKL